MKWIMPPMKSFLFCLIVCCFSSSYAINNHAALDQSTQLLVNLNTTNQPAKLIDQASLQQIKERRDLLIKKLQNNPRQFYKYLLSAKQTSSLPISIQPYVEQEVTNIEGILIIRAALYLDKNKQPSEVLQYVLQTKEGTQYNLNFYDEPINSLETGQTISVKHGFKLADEHGNNQLVISAQDMTILKTVTPKAIPSSIGPQNTFVFLVNFQNNPNDQPWSIDSIKDTVFNTINNMYYESSYRQTTVVGDAAGWITANVNNDADCGSVMNAVVAAGNNAGINLAGYTHLVYVFPYAPNCYWAGLGNVGTVGTSTAWINGYNTANVIGHELGHNLGLYHSRLLQCDGGPISGNCSTVEYGDRADIMGAGGVSHFNAFQKERLGWLNFQNSPAIQTINTSGTYTIDAFETTNGNPKAIKIAKTNYGDFYYLEFRQPIGFDSGLGNSGDYTQGVIIHQGKTYLANSSDLLRMNASTLQNNVALLPGTSFSDPNAYQSITITVNSVSPQGANITATFGSLPPSCVRANPTMTITPSTTQWVKAGESANYTITLKNNDNQYCSQSGFTFSTNVPTGLTASLSPSLMILGPGAQSSTFLQVNTTTSTPGNIYAVTVTGKNANAASYTASVNASVGVQATCTQSNPTISINPTSQTGKPGQSLSYEFTVQNNDTSACSASTFNVTKVVPSKFGGALNPASFQLNPGTSGTGNFSLTADKKAKRGSYGFTLTAKNSANTKLTNSANGTYVVKK